MRGLKVKDVMKTKFDVVDGMATIKEALDEMQHVDTKCLIVEKRNDDDEYGMLLISDIAREVIAKNRSIERVNVYEVMSKPILSVHPEMKLRYCARIFGRFRLSRAPVIENHKVVGIISLTDVVVKGLCKSEELCQS